jgi:hypothetical protein
MRSCMVGAATRAAVWPFTIISKRRVPLTTQSYSLPTAVILLSAVHASTGIFMHEVRTHHQVLSGLGEGFVDFDKIQ